MYPAPLLKPNTLNRWMDDKASIKRPFVWWIVQRNDSVWSRVNTQNLTWWEKRDKEPWGPQVCWRFRGCPGKETLEYRLDLWFYCIQLKTTSGPHEGPETMCLNERNAAESFVSEEWNIGTSKTEVQAENHTFEISRGPKMTEKHTYRPGSKHRPNSKWIFAY